MLSPPNSGSKLADFLAKSFIMNYIFGPALKQLRTDKKSLPQKISTPKYELGIIAGKYDEKSLGRKYKIKKYERFSSSAKYAHIHYGFR